MSTLQEIAASVFASHRADSAQITACFVNARLPKEDLGLFARGWRDEQRRRATGESRGSYLAGRGACRAQPSSLAPRPALRVDWTPDGEHVVVSRRYDDWGIDWMWGDEADRRRTP